jgi:DsbC/DsbD-like thiol-disulfide interchange protein
MKWIALFLLLSLCMPSILKADVPGLNSVRAELLTNVANVKPNDIFTIGVLFEIAQGWHIYWKNPGDSGLPTSINFVINAEFSVGKLQWPVPRRFYRSGGIIDYGYAESALLSARVKTPKDLSPGSLIPIQAKISWLSCERVCIPGQANLEIKIPVAEVTSPANSELFAKWEKRLPTDMGSTNNPFAVKIKGFLSSEETPSLFTVLLDWKVPPTGVEWFPVSGGALDIANILYKTDGKKTHITFSAKVYLGQELTSNVLETVVAYTDADGECKGVNLPIQLRE